jgi:hypothetical protein
MQHARVATIFDPLERHNTKMLAWIKMPHMVKALCRLHKQLLQTTQTPSCSQGGPQGHQLHLYNHTAAGRPLLLGKNDPASSQ